MSNPGSGNNSSRSGTGGSPTPSSSSRSHTPGRAWALIVGLALGAFALFLGQQLFWENGSSVNPSSAAENVNAQLKRAEAAVKAADLAQKAIEAQAAADKEYVAKNGEATEAAVAYEQAKADKSANASMLESAAQKSKAAEQALRTSADVATRRAREAIVAVAASQKSLLEAQSGDSAASMATFQWTLFVILSLIFLSVFPLSAYAFRRREVPRLIAQLKVDYEMLGSQPNSLTPTGHQESDIVKSRWNSESYYLHCGLAILASLVGAAIFCWRPPTSLLDVNAQHGMQLGFLGAYIYCLNLVYRRYTTRDLQPHVYLSCGIGLIAGMVFNYAAFTAITNVANSPSPDAAEFKGVGAGAAAILAFSLGYFPNLAIRWFGRISRSSVRERQRRSDALPLSFIDGVSELHESRLQDEGIDNVQNLASADIHDLVEKTPYSAQEIVEWVDQALLYLYIDSGEIDSFRRAGVRSVTDFRDIWAGFIIRYKSQPDGSVMRIPPPLAQGEFEQRRKDIAAQLATTEQRLDCLFLATEQGPNMDHVRTYWDNVQSASIQTRDLLINRVCGGVGRALRESIREGSQLTPSDLLTQVAQGLFAAAAMSGKEESVIVTAESLYGQAYLKNQLQEIAEARRLYLKCIEQFPDDPVAYNDLAWLDLQSRSQKSDLRVARDFADKAVRLTAAAKATSEHAAKVAGERKAAEETAGRIAEAAQAAAEQDAKLAEADKLTSDLAGYRDTLALAEIRVGNLAKGVAESKQAIADWDKLKRGKEPRFLDTLVSAAEGYAAKGDQTKAESLLQEVENLNYARPATIERIKELRERMA